jgi:predicted TIM-barrel fold metal-dependent hydrolase
MGQLLLLGLLLASSKAWSEPSPRPVIDMHIHAWTLGSAAGATSCPGSRRSYYPPIDPRAPFDLSKIVACTQPFHAPLSDERLMRDSLAMLRRYNIRHAVTSGDPTEVAKWRAAAPAQIIAGFGFGESAPPSVEELRRLYDAKAFSIFAEVSTQYGGTTADDPRWEPYFALAEELDIPVGIHMGEGPPAVGRFPGYEKYRSHLTSTFQLEEVLIRHPKLRIYAMHYGSPLVDDTIAMMFSYPNLYVDVACNDWSNPRAQFYAQLKQMIDAGFEKRIMFGSDQMYWPQAIGEAIHSIEAAPFLSKSQKRDILYNNAARFLRLSDAQIKADNAR